MTTLTCTPIRRGAHYHLPGGRVYPSVTSILGVIAKPALVHWAARTAASLVLADPTRFATPEDAARAIYDRRDQAADRGALIHQLAESFARGMPPDVGALPPPAQGYAQAFLGWATVLRPVPMFAEAVVTNDTYQYAGTLDLVAVLGDGRAWLVDFKTTDTIYREATLQAEAYRNAEWIYPTSEHDPIPMPTVAETILVLLRDDGTYEHRVLRGDFEAFLAARRLWEWTHTTKER